jgi:hypothetical protein
MNEIKQNEKNCECRECKRKDCPHNDCYRRFSTHWIKVNGEWINNGGINGCEEIGGFVKNVQ